MATAFYLSPSSPRDGGSLSLLSHQVEKSNGLEKLALLD